MCRFIFIILFSIASMLLQAQNTHITCIFPKNTPLRNIKLKTYKELVTYTDTTLQTVKIKEDSANFYFSLDDTKLLFFPTVSKKLNFLQFQEKII